ncbi:MAG TPA: hypothetical protein VID19_08245 [Candidatus Eremiobacteraceae bacterium]|jgi:hypothetical protein
MKNLLVALFLVAPLAASAAPAVPYLPVPRGAAVILNTGSTNTLGYRVVIQRSGAAEYINGPKRATAVVPASLTTHFFADVQAAMPLLAHTATTCMKSASFGSSLFVWWKGSRSGDLTCPAGDTIASDVAKIAQALNLSTGLRLVRPIPMLTNEPRRPLPLPTPTP